MSRCEGSGISFLVAIEDNSTCRIVGTCGMWRGSDLWTSIKRKMVDRRRKAAAARRATER